ncbi:MAG TPA: hypothetical protein EYO33_14330 [Phycisphaerales bacterium]|nr:hypothetical protein [Phycisphaerales bacterium]
MSVVSCPRCQIALKKARLGLICRNCEGCWLRFEEFDRAVLASEDSLVGAGLKATLSPDSPEIDLTPAVHCPICTKRCRRFPYLVDSGIIVDACSKHGMWLDDGELSAIRTYCRLNDCMPDEPKKKVGLFARLFGKKA